MSENSYNVFLSLINYFSNSTYDRLEFDIAIQLINHSRSNDYLSMEELSNLSHVSQSTISRFVRKLGFKNYRDFAVNLNNSLKIAKYERNACYSLLNDNIEELFFNKAVDHIKVTKDTLNISKIDKIIDNLLNTSYTAIIGTSETINHFSRFRKDLIANGHPCFLFYNSSSQKEFDAHLKEECSLILAVLSNDYIKLFDKMLLNAKDKGVTKILITQDRDERVDNDFDIVYHYGLPNTYRLGDYSLEYLATMMSYYLVKKLNDHSI